MKDVLQMGKELIEKGKALNDEELIKMGFDLVNSLPTPTKEVEISRPKVYICRNCNHSFDVDKPNRRKCPNCGKFTLFIPAEITLETEVATPKKTNDYTTSILKDVNTQQRKFVDEDGTEHVYTRREPIDVSRSKVNMFNDDGIAEHDRHNEELKKFTKVSPRVRKPTKKKKVTCYVCNVTEEVNPIHAVGKFYRCSKCARRASRV